VRAEALGRYLEEAGQITRRVEAEPPEAAPCRPGLTSDFERTRWFPLPSEALEELRG
jgi:hypothetical protein